VELKLQLRPERNRDTCRTKNDLAEFAYGGNNDRMKPDVENLVRNGLIEFNLFVTRKPVLADSSHSPRTAIAYSPTRRAMVRGSLFITTLPNHAKPITTPNSTLVSERDCKDRRSRRPKLSYRSRLRTEEASLSRFRKGRQRPQFRRWQTHHCRESRSMGR